jgi:signal transduction histidine kinase
VGKIRGDPQALEQVLVNLLDNAVKYSPEPRPIDVELTRAGEWAHLRVSDRGCGIPADEQERIFEPFYRAGSPSCSGERSTTGSGLGLALVRRTVSAHGGRVTVTSQPGEGSTFVVSLPLLTREGA